MAHHNVPYDAANDRGMVVMLGVIVGAFLVLAGIFAFAAYFGDADMLSADMPAATETTGAR